MTRTEHRRRAGSHHNIEALVDGKVGYAVLGA